MDSKGQESMPIQLLMGVTILTFVLTIGIYSYKQVCASQYQQKVRAGLNNLARTMEQAYQGGVGTTPPAITIDAKVPSGCNVNLESIRIVEGTSSACEDSIGKSECAMAVAVAKTDKSTSISSKAYIDIPGHVSIKQEGIKCREGLNLQDVYKKSFNETEQCGWTQGVFNLKIEKEDTDQIIIKEMGE